MKKESKGKLNGHLVLIGSMIKLMPQVMDKAFS